MKALIFNSGIGKRMQELTAKCPKSMVHLYNDETIFERQIRLLQEAGIKEVVITTGPYPEMLKEICSKPCYSNMSFSFVHNEIYDSSNYIYSMFKARGLINDDIFILHGDLVFDRTLIPALMKNKEQNICLINKYKPLPEKDFKGRIVDNELREVGINIFDDNCFAFQPLYKLSKEVAKAWVDCVVKFVNQKNINVYAENAFNEVLKGLHVRPFSYHKHFIDEVDNQTDLKRVNSEIEQWDYKTQTIKKCSNYTHFIEAVLKTINASRPFIVVDSFLKNDLINKFPNSTIFSSFHSNPKYEEMLEGLSLFKKNKCDSIVSIGGGSCIDTAKAIKLSINSDVDSDIPTFKQAFKFTDIKHICIPSTSGTGSESTKHAVLYLDDVKQSISNPAILPEFVGICPKLVTSLPEYHKKSTMMDALCQCIESLWSRKSTRVSRKYALTGLKYLQDSLKGYLNNDLNSIRKAQLGANYSGKAINISETTAAHALSYKITSLFGVPHGHAVAICMNAILSTTNVKTKFGNFDIKEIFNCFAESFELEMHIKLSNNDMNLLINSVNKDRLRNFPFEIEIPKIYTFISKKV